MKSFLLLSFKHRLKGVSAVSLLLTLAWYALLVVTSVDGWKGAQEDARIWRSGQKEKCERLFSQAESEIAAIDKGRCEYRGDFIAHSQCLDSDKRRRADLIQALNKSSCPSFALAGYGDVPVLLSQQPPEPLPIYALESKGMHFPILPATFLGLTAILLLLTDFVRRVTTEGNAGWRRLTVVASAVSAAVAGLLLHGGKWGGETLATSFAALCVAAASIVYGRAAWQWVADGFASGKGAAPAPQTVIGKVVESVPEPVESIEEAHAEPVADIGETPSASVSVAPFWPRLWARCVDLTLCWFVGSLCAVVLPDLRFAFPGIGGVMADLLVGMAFICGAVLLYEWQFVFRFGATPGKMLLGISVSSVDGGLPSSDAARTRAWVFLKSGLYLCFYVPVLQILGAVAAWRRKDGAQPWDMAARTFTGQRPVGLVRFLSVVLLAFCMFSLMVGLSKVAKEATKEEVRRSVLN